MILIFIMICNLLLSATVHSATYYVAKTGCTGSCTNSNSCSAAQTRATAKLTITGSTGGMQCLASGDTLEVDAGVYDENLTLNVPSGTTGAHTIIRGINSTDVILRPTSFGSISAANVASVIIPLSGQHHITVKNFVVDMTSMPATAGISTKGIETDAGATTHHLLFEDLEIFGSRGDATRIRNTYGTIFRRLHIHDLEASQADGSGATGVYFQYNPNGTEGNIVEDSVIEETPPAGGNGITMVDAEDAIVRRNIIRNVSSGCFAHKGTVSDGALSLNLLFYNNILSGCVGGINFNTDDDGNNRFYNNTIYGTVNSSFGHCIRRGNPVEALTSAQAALVKNNICWGLANTNFQVSGNLYSNPSFTDATNGDFTLQSGSSAIDSGSTQSSITDDFLGVSRPQGIAYDMGAYEFSSAPSADITSNLIAHYDFENDLTSETGSHNGSAVGTPSYVAGAVGSNAVDLDGSTDAVLVTHNSTLSITGDITVSFWMKSEGLPTSGQVQTLIGKESTTNSDTAYFIYMFHNGSSVNLYWYHNTNGAGSSTNLNFTGHVPVVNEWRHITFVRSIAPKQTSLYIDGNLVQTLSWTTNPAANTGNMSIGYDTQSSGEYFNGVIDDMRIYARALSALDVDAIYDLGSIPGGDTTGPVVSITSPADGSIIGNTYQVQADAQDESGIQDVTFYRDTSTQLCTPADTSAPYTCSWDTTGVSEGSHTLHAVARDTVPNSSTSSTITITIDNTDPTTPGSLTVMPGESGSDYIMALDWSDSTDASGSVSYEVERCDGVSCSDFEGVGNPSSSNFFDDLLASGTVYCYRVRARDIAGNTSSYSSTVCKTSLSPLMALANPSTLSTTHSTTVTTLASPSTLATTHSSTITSLGEPSTLSTTNSTSPVFLGNPSTLGTP